MNIRNDSAHQEDHIPAINTHHRAIAPDSGDIGPHCFTLTPEGTDIGPHPVILNQEI